MHQMQQAIQDHIKEHVETIQEFFKTHEQKIIDLVDLIECRLKSGGKILVFGNGGSSSDASHFVGELVGRFEKERKGLPAISLSADSVNVTAIGNDYGYENIFARQVEALAANKDILIGISTSGSSPNVLKALEISNGTLKVLITSQRVEPTETQLEISSNIRFIFKVPSNRTATIQECHITLLHLLAKLIEERFK